MNIDATQRIITKLGGARVVADALKIAVTTVYRWTYPVNRGGTGGNIPIKRMNQIIAYASKKGIRLSIKDFFK
jgi:hypothetical protein